MPEGVLAIASLFASEAKSVLEGWKRVCVEGRWKVCRSAWCGGRLLSELAMVYMWRLQQVNGDNWCVAVGE